MVYIPTVQREPVQPAAQLQVFAIGPEHVPPFAQLGVQIAVRL